MRSPWSDRQRYFFKPGRWDCEYDLVLMDPIVTGASVGMWVRWWGQSDSAVGCTWREPSETRPGDNYAVSEYDGVYRP
jgi:hypothetical protein